jgi:hypothetical protein
VVRPHSSKPKVVAWFERGIKGSNNFKQAKRGQGGGECGQLKEGKKSAGLHLDFGL